MALKPTIDNFIAQNSSKGSFFRMIHDNCGVNNKQAATTTSGYIQAKRYPNPLVLPSSFGSGVTGVIPTMLDLNTTEANSLLVAGLEVLLGTINMSTGVFTDGSAMPSRRPVGSDTAVQTASMMTFLVADTAVTATAPVMTLTYTNERATGGQTATLTLGNNPTINSAFLFDPLASTDTGIQNISNLTKSAGTAGTMKVYGFIPMQTQVTEVLAHRFASGIMATPMPWVSLQASDTIAVYSFGGVAASINMDMIFSGVADS